MGSEILSGSYLGSRVLEGITVLFSKAELIPFLVTEAQFQLRIIITPSYHVHGGHLASR